MIRTVRLSFEKSHCSFNAIIWTETLLTKFLFSDSFAVSSGFPCCQPVSSKLTLAYCQDEIETTETVHEFSRNVRLILTCTLLQFLFDCQNDCANFPLRMLNCNGWVVPATCLRLSIDKTCVQYCGDVYNQYNLDRIDHDLISKFGIFVFVFLMQVHERWIRSTLWVSEAPGETKKMRYTLW